MNKKLCYQCLNCLGCNKLEDEEFVGPGTCKINKTKKEICDEIFENIKRREKRIEKKLE